MKKLFIPLGIIAIVFASCKKYETSEELDLSTLEKVVVKGTVYADLDETTSNPQFAPAGTKVYISVPYTQYNPNAGSGNWISEPAILNANGQFSIEVPVLSKGINAKISFDDFTYTVKRYNAAGEVENVQKYFSLNDITVNGLGSRSNNEQPLKNIDVKYTSSVTNPLQDSLTPTHEVNVETAFFYIRSNNGNSSDTVAASNANVFVKIALVIDGEVPARTYEVEKVATIDANGKINLKVPMVQGGKATITLRGEEFWKYHNGTEEKTYRYTLTGGATVYNQDYVLAQKYFYTRGSVIE